MKAIPPLIYFASIRITPVTKDLSEDRAKAARNISSINSMYSAKYHRQQIKYVGKHFSFLRNFTPHIGKNLHITSRFHFSKGHKNRKPRLHAVSRNFHILSLQEKTFIGCNANTMWSTLGPNVFLIASIRV